MPQAALTPKLPVRIKNLGRRPYEEVWDLQRKLQRELIDGTGEDTLLLCEHPPTITLGKSTAPDSLRRSKAEIESHGIPVYEIERGGDITYHGPGQLVAYPLLDLRKVRTDVGWYMRQLEEIILQTLQRFEIKGCRIPQKTGVWIEPADRGKKVHPRKIASIGVRLSRWCTLHGMALNVRNCSEGFRWIHPCGFHGIEVTSMEEERSTYQLSEVAPVLTDVFCDVLNYSKT